MTTAGATSRPRRRRGALRSGRSMPAPDALPPALPRNFLRPCVLLLLREEPAHGYDLLQRLRQFGFMRDDPGRLYRALSALEDAADTLNVFLARYEEFVEIRPRRQPTRAAL